MARRTQISQSLLNKLAAVSKEQGVRIDIERDGMTIRISPDPLVETETAARYLEDDPPPPPPIHPRLEARERSVMDFVEAAGIGNAVDPIAVRNTGPHTYQRLKERGFIEIFQKTVDRRSWTEIALTAKGARALKEEKAYYTKYLVL